MKTSQVTVAACIFAASLSAPADAYIFYDCNQKASLTTPAMVADINPGAPDAAKIYSGRVNQHSHMIQYDGDLYFQADNGLSGSELWRISNGGSPQLVQDLAPGIESSSPHSFVILGARGNYPGKLYFAASTPATGEELYVYDGASITLAAELTPGPEGGAPIDGLIRFQDSIYFVQREKIGNIFAWRFDGSTVEKVQSINQSGALTVNHNPDYKSRFFTHFDGRLYFVLIDYAQPAYSLFSFDGSSVEHVKDLTSPVSGYFPIRRFDLGVYQGALYFGSVITPPSYALLGVEQLWRYDGQGAPVIVSDELALIEWDRTQARDFQVFKDKLYFKVGTKLYRYDGGEVRNLTFESSTVPNVHTGLSTYSTNLINTLFFSGFVDNSLYAEPYIFGGASANLLANLKPDNQTPPGSHPTRGIQVGSDFYFYADDETHGRELWSFRESSLVGLECLVVVAPIWENWFDWDVERRTVIVKTHLLTPDAAPERLFSQYVEVTRGEDSRIEAVTFNEQQNPVPYAYGFFTSITDSTTGALVEYGHEIIGVPSEHDLEVFDRQVIELKEGMLGASGR